MATIALPDCPLPNEAQPFLRDFGGVLTPFLGGPEQRVNRIGTRFGVRYVMPLMDGQAAMSFVSRLLRGRNERVSIPWPITAFDTGNPGSPKVSSGVSGGSAIPVAGLASGYAIREGQFFSVMHDGRRYVHMSTGSATTSWSIYPPLRTALSANDVIEVRRPIIEGLVSPGDELGWQHALDLKTAIAFSVVESR